MPLPLGLELAADIFLVGVAELGERDNHCSIAAQEDDVALMNPNELARGGSACLVGPGSGVC
jgi:hypothetical protein